MLTYHTAGESHGKGLLALIDGFPAGLEINPEIINYELKRRQGGYGRGGRQKLETDTAEILNFFPRLPTNRHTKQGVKLADTDIDNPCFNDVSSSRVCAIKLMIRLLHMLDDGRHIVTVFDKAR